MSSKKAIVDVMKIESMSYGKNGKTTIVFLGGKKETISESAYLSSFLYPGKVVTKEEWDKIKGIDNQGKERAYVEKIISSRLYSPKQIRDKLMTVKKMSYVDSSLLVNSMINEGILNPKSYAETKADEMKEKGFSKKGIVKELKAQEISDDVIDEIKRNLDSDNSTAVNNLLNSALRKNKGKSFSAVTEKMRIALKKKGYEESEIQLILQNFSMETPEFSSDKRQLEALERTARQTYDKISRTSKDSRLKQQAFYRALISKGFSKEEIDEIIEREELYFD